jgi:hypothetical protein
MTNVLVLTYWSFPDSLIQAYTLPYLKIIKKNLSAGGSVILLTLEKEAMSEENEIAIRKRLAEDGIIWLPFSYRPFGINAFFLWLGIFVKLIRLIFAKKIDVIHCWATPAGAIGYFLSVLTGRKLILDSYEPHAEAMVENGTWKKNSIAFRILFWLERKQSERAWYAISATEGMREYAHRKYKVKLENFIVKPACVNMNLFSESKIKNEALLTSLNFKDKIVCVYAGKFGGIYLTNEVFDFFKIAHDFWGDRFRVILLSSHHPKEINDFCSAANLDHEIIVLKFVPHEKVADYMGLADFAITPVKPVPTKKYCTPIKDGEYWALGLPVVIPANISDDARIIQEHNAGAVLQDLNKLSYKEAVLKIDDLLQKPKLEIRKEISALARQYRSFDIAEKTYKEVYGTENI